MKTNPAVTVTYVPINGATHEYRAHGRDFDCHADAFIAALTDGEGVLERDGDGCMRLAVNGRQSRPGGSFNTNDQEAKEEVVREIARTLQSHEYGYTALKVERDGEGNIVKIDGLDTPDLIAYWNRRIG